MRLVPVCILVDGSSTSHMGFVFFTVLGGKCVLRLSSDLDSVIRTLRSMTGAKADKLVVTKEMHCLQNNMVRNRNCKHAFNV